MEISTLPALQWNMAPLTVISHNGCFVAAVNVTSENCMLQISAEFDAVEAAVTV